MTQENIEAAIDKPVVEPVELPKKRRGRPPKVRLPGEEEKPRRKPGRPRKAEAASGVVSRALDQAAREPQAKPRTGTAHVANSRAAGVGGLLPWAMLVISLIGILVAGGFVRPRKREKPEGGNAVGGTAYSATGNAGNAGNERTDDFPIPR